MLHKIIHTLGSRLIMAGLNLALLIVTTRWMGAEVKGEVSLLVLYLSVSVLVTGLFGGPALVYLVPRFSFRHILTQSYGWSVIGVGMLTIFLELSSLGSDIPMFRFFRMALLESLIAAHLMILLGRDRVSLHNVLQVAKLLLTVGILTYLIYQGNADFIQFVNAYELSLIITFLASIAVLYKSEGNNQTEMTSSWIDTLKAGWRYGAIMQLGNISQLLNYRLSYILLEFLISPPKLAMIRIGIYSAAIQISEALWQFSRSVSTVQYAAVSNLDDRSEALRISLRLARLNYFVTLLGTLTLLTVPLAVYNSILGEEFREVKLHFILLSPGIIALAFSSAINHFFAGVGDVLYNTKTSVYGLALTLLLAYPSIVYFETRGAALATSVVYVFQAVLQFYFLARTDGVKASQLMVTKKDINDFISRLKTALAAKS